MKADSGRAHFSLLAGVNDSLVKSYQPYTNQKAPWYLIRKKEANLTALLG